MVEINNPRLLIPAHVKDAAARKKAKDADLRVIDMLVDVSAPCPGRIEDWPASIQDQLYKAIMDKCVEDGRTYNIVDSRCGRDNGKWYLHVTLAWKRGMDAEARH